MPLVDSLLRQGHLSEQALVEAIMTGERPAHLDRCDVCLQRARETGLWLDEVRQVGFETADRIFTPEKLAAQQAQIMRKLEQADAPPRVIAFPNSVERQREPGGGRRVAAAWVGIAAAAGLILGVVGGQVTARMSMTNPATTAMSAGATPAAAIVPPPATASPVEPQRLSAPLGPSILEMEYGTEMRVPGSLSFIDEVTPVLVHRVAANVRSGS